MSEAVSFTVRGDAQTQGNLRRGRHGGLYESNPRLEHWRSLIASEGGRAMNGRGPIRDDVRLHVLFVFSRPKGHWTTKGVLSAEGRRKARPPKDIDKLLRAVLDSLTSVVLLDDGQVAEVDAKKDYAGRHEPERCEVVVVPLPFARPNPARPSGWPASEVRSATTRKASTPTSRSSP